MKTQLTDMEEILRLRSIIKEMREKEWEQFVDKMGILGDYEENRKSFDDYTHLLIFGQK